MLRRNSFSGIRVILVLLIMAGIFTVMGVSDTIQDINGSHADFADMKISDFREGDIIGGEIIETLGCAFTEETTEMLYGIIPTTTSQSAVYYLVPFYDSLDDAVPNKMLLYKTGNSKQELLLEKLVEETGEWYSGREDKTYSHVLVESAEVRNMDSEERDYMSDYIKKYVEYYYSEYDTDALYTAFMDSIVPYVIQYKANTTFIMYIGLAVFAVLLITLIIMFVVRKGRNSVPVTADYSPASGSNLYGEDPFSQSAAQQFGAQGMNAAGSDISNMPAPPSNPFATKAVGNDISDMPAPTSNPFATKAAGNDIGDMPAPTSNPFATQTSAAMTAATAATSATMSNASSADISSMPAPPSNPFATKKNDYGETNEAAEEKESLFTNPKYNIPTPAAMPTAEPTMESLFIDETPDEPVAPTVPEKQPELETIDISAFSEEAAPSVQSPAAAAPASSLESLFPQTSKDDFVADTSFDSVSVNDDEEKTRSEFESMLMGDDNS